MAKKAKKAAKKKAKKREAATGAVLTDCPTLFTNRARSRVARAARIDSRGESRRQSERATEREDSRHVDAECQAAEAENMQRRILPHNPT